MQEVESFPDIQSPSEFAPGLEPKARSPAPPSTMPAEGVPVSFVPPGSESKAPAPHPPGTLETAEGFMMSTCDDGGDEQVDQAEMAQFDEDALQPGAQVLLHGLTSASNLNGRLGTCCYFIEESGRWSVQVEGEAQAKNVLPHNLQVVGKQEEAGDPASDFAVDYSADYAVDSVGDSAADYADSAADSAANLHLLQLEAEEPARESEVVELGVDGVAGIPQPSAQAAMVGYAQEMAQQAADWVSADLRASQAALAEATLEEAALEETRSRSPSI